MKMVNIPKTYREWIEVLDVFVQGENDTDVLQAMRAGQLEWQAGVAERFIKRLEEALNTRLVRANSTYQKRTSQMQSLGSDTTQAIIAYRKELIFLQEAVNLAVMPEDARNHLVDMVQKIRNDIQASLLDSAKSDRSGRLASIIRNNKIN